jgi:hypothetical protein
VQKGSVRNNTLLKLETQTQYVAYKERKCMSFWVHFSTSICQEELRKELRTQEKLHSKTKGLFFSCQLCSATTPFNFIG